MSLTRATCRAVKWASRTIIRALAASSMAEFVAEQRPQRPAIPPAVRHFMDHRSAGSKEEVSSLGLGARCQRRITGGPTALAGAQS
jgi:hypothetical protein